MSHEDEGSSGGAAEDSPLELSLPTLEAPIATDLTPAAQGALFLDETAVAMNATRLAVVEAFLSLVVRDLSYADFMREVLLVFLKGIKCEAGSIFEVDAAGQSLFFRAVAGQASDRLQDVRIPVGKGIVGYVHESRQLACVQDCRNDPRFMKSLDNTVGFESRNLIAVPVIIRDRVFCVIEVLNRIGAEHFSEEDLALVRYVADVASRVIEARLMINWSASQRAA